MGPEVVLAHLTKTQHKTPGPISGAKLGTYGGVNSGSYHSGPNPENGMTGQGYNRSRCLKWSAKTLTSDEGKSQKNLPKNFFF